MFGFGKNKATSKNKLQKFLDEADECYIKAFETRSIGVLKKHFTLECCRKMSVWIVNEASSRFFGDEKFRTTTWTVLEETDSLVTIQKECTYKNIKISMSRNMKVSDDYKEVWTVEVTPDGYMVRSVAGT